MTVNVAQHIFYHIFKSLKYKSGSSLEVFVPPCQPCPIGAKCNSVIQVLPNYWGYLNKSVSIFRCPEDYCCQGNDTCGKIDSCNIGRIGMLCGNCEPTLTEALFTPKCVTIKSCRTTLLITLIISAAVVLLSLN